MRGLSRRLLSLGVLVPIVLVADALVGAATADASGCFLGPYVQTDSPPLGCPVTVLRSKDHAPLTDPPRVQVMRDGEWIELTATVTARTELSLDVGYYETDCDGHVVSTRFDQEPYEEITLDIADAAEGDQLWVDATLAGTVGAPGTCPDPANALARSPSCSGNYEGCPYNDPPEDDGNLEDDARVGCMSAGGGSMDLALVVLVGAFVAGARRRRRGASSSERRVASSARRTAILGVLAAAVLAPRAADASGCYFGPNLLSSPAPRLGCPIVIAQNAYSSGAEPTLRVIRDTDNIDVTGTVTTEQRQIYTSYYQLDCDGLVVDETESLEPYDVYTIELSQKAMVGDMLLVEGITSPIQPADPDVPCEALIEPTSSCNIMADNCHYDYDDDTEADDTENVGCMSAGSGATSAGTLILVLGFASLARRRRR